MKKFTLSLAILLGGYSAIQACQPIVQAVSVPIVTAAFVAPVVTAQVVTPVVSQTLVSPVVSAVPYPVVSAVSAYPVVSAFSSYPVFASTAFVHSHAFVSPIVSHRAAVVVGGRAAVVAPRVAVTRTRSVTRIR